MKIGDRPQPSEPGSVPNRADLLGAAGWLAFGAAVLAASWRMDRLASLSINPLSAPGLVPGLLGALMIVFGAALGARAWWRGASARRDAVRVAQAAREAHPPRSGEARRIALALLLCIGYAAGLLGKGLPFWLASSAFLFITILVFRILDHDAESDPPLRRVALSTLVIALAASALIALLFQEVFLVRLP